MRDKSRFSFHMISAMSLVIRRVTRLSPNTIKHFTSLRLVQHYCKYYGQTYVKSSSYVLDVLRLINHRNVGVLAHVDAGKTTITEQMLSLSGTIKYSGSVDKGTTVMDFLPAERERGITIQSAAVSFRWKLASGKGRIHLIDTPGHIDFIIEVNRSVSILDGAILVVDAVAGVQSQTQSLWRTINRSNGSTRESLPCLLFINKMDRFASDFYEAVTSIEKELPGINHLLIQLPLFRIKHKNDEDICGGLEEFRPLSKKYRIDDGEFIGLVNLIEMKASMWLDNSSPLPNSSSEQHSPYVIPLEHSETRGSAFSYITKTAKLERQALIESLAEVNETIEEYYIMGKNPENNILIKCVRESTTQNMIVPILAGSGLRRMGIELLLDTIFDLLPCPIDKMSLAFGVKKKYYPLKKRRDQEFKSINYDRIINFPWGKKVPYGHPLHHSLLAFVFKVIIMKRRGRTGNGRMTFARIYSGKIQTKKDVVVISTFDSCDDSIQNIKSRIEQVGALFELACDKSNALEGGTCHSGEVCALIGLKTVVTGDTLISPSNLIDYRKKNLNERFLNINNNLIFDLDTNANRFIGGIKYPNPVVTVRMEALCSHEQEKLSNALSILSVEDPSLRVSDDESFTLVSGLGELHLEIVRDTLRREYGVEVWTGLPNVAYKESIMIKDDDTSPSIIHTKGMVTNNYEIDSKRMIVSISLRLQHIFTQTTQSTLPTPPRGTTFDSIVRLGDAAKLFLGINKEKSKKEISRNHIITHALTSGCLRSLKRGPLGSYPIVNIICEIVDVHIEGGLRSDNFYPGFLRTSVSNILSTFLIKNKHYFVMLEPFMSIEVFVPKNMVSTVISDFTSRRGIVYDIKTDSDSSLHFNIFNISTSPSTIMYGEVPLSEIIGYANILRNITRGLGTFSTSYKGYLPCEIVPKDK